MRVFIVGTAVLVTLFLALVVCVREGPAQRTSYHEMLLEKGEVPGTVDVVDETVACAACLETLSEKCICMNAQKATIAISAGTGTGTGTVRKLPRAAVDAKDWDREAARSGVEVGAVGLLL